MLETPKTIKASFAFENTSINQHQLTIPNQPGALVLPVVDAERFASHVGAGDERDPGPNKQRPVGGRPLRLGLRTAPGHGPHDAQKRLRPAPATGRLRQHEHTHQAHPQSAEIEFEDW